MSGYLAYYTDASGYSVSGYSVSGYSAYYTAASGYSVYYIDSSGYSAYCTGLNQVTPNIAWILTKLSTSTMTIAMVTLNKHLI